LTGVSQRWIQWIGVPLFVCGGASAFLGMLAVMIGGAGLIGSGRSRATAIVGLALGLLGACMFFAILGRIPRGG
jgi:hypothetical protein